MRKQTFQCFSLKSDYRKYLPGQLIRIRPKIEVNCVLFLDIVSSAIMNDLSMTFTSGLKVGVKCIYQQWNWITVANYFGTPPDGWVHGYLYFEPGAWIWTKGFNQGTCTLMAFAWNFFGVFLIFFANHLWGIYSISGLKYSLVGWSVRCQIDFFSVCFFWPSMCVVVVFCRFDLEAN